MNLLHFYSMLPEGQKTKYIESLIKDGKVNEDIWNDLFHYLTETYTKMDYKEEIPTLIEGLHDEDRNNLMDIVKKYDNDLHESLTNRVFNYNDIIKFDPKKVEEVLSDYDRETIVKTTYTVSPETKQFLQAIFTDIDFEQVKKELGNLPINEIVEIQNSMLMALNEKE